MINNSKNMLLLMRHAKSDWANSELVDKDRPLNERGRSAAPIMANWLWTNRMVPAKILCSTAVRTRQTLDLMMSAWHLAVAQSVLDHAKAIVAPEIDFMDELYLAPALNLLAFASKANTQGCLLILGHNPGMEEVASYLSGRHVEMPTAAIATLEPRGDDWPLDWKETNDWNWRGLVKPRDLSNKAI
jgi:phosphohistidine phosphatase